jgi:hypothetical protein
MSEFEPTIQIVDLGADEDLQELENSGVDLDTAAADAFDMSTAFTVEEAANVLEVSPQRVRALLSKSVLNGVKRGGVWFICAEDVRQFAQMARKAGRPRVTWESLDVRELTPEEEADRAQKERERSELAAIRSDYEWFRACEKMPLEELRDNASVEADFGDYEMHQKNEHKRRLQAMIVLERRESN